MIPFRCCSLHRASQDIYNLFDRSPSGNLRVQGLSDQPPGSTGLHDEKHHVVLLISCGAVRSHFKAGVAMDDMQMHNLAPYFLELLPSFHLNTSPSKST